MAENTMPTMWKWGWGAWPRGSVHTIGSAKVQRSGETGSRTGALGEATHPLGAPDEGGANPRGEGRNQAAKYLP